MDLPAARAKALLDDEVDEASQESFPSSDPPAFNPLHIGSPPGGPAGHAPAPSPPSRRSADAR